MVEDEVCKVHAAENAYRLLVFEDYCISTIGILYQFSFYKKHSEEQRGLLFWLRGTVNCSVHTSKQLSNDFLLTGYSTKLTGVRIYLFIYSLISVEAACGPTINGSEIGIKDLGFSFGLDSLFILP